MSPAETAGLHWINAYSDGACSGNPGPGGWAYLIEWPGGIEEGSGGDRQTTNNRMELIAAREAMAAFLRKSVPGQGLRIHTDSRNVIGWLSEHWKRKANIDLFPELDRLTGELGARLVWVWVHGHQDNPGNNRVDELAVAACRRVEPDSQRD